VTSGRRVRSASGQATVELAVALPLVVTLLLLVVQVGLVVRDQVPVRSTAATWTPGWTRCRAARPRCGLACATGAAPTYRWSASWYPT